MFTIKGRAHATEPPLQDLSIRGIAKEDAHSHESASAHHVTSVSKNVLPSSTSETQSERSRDTDHDRRKLIRHTEPGRGASAPNGGNGLLENGCDIRVGERGVEQVKVEAVEERGQSGGDGGRRKLRIKRPEPLARTNDAKRHSDDGSHAGSASGSHDDRYSRSHHKDRHREEHRDEHTGRVQAHSRSQNRPHSDRERSRMERPRSSSRSRSRDTRRRDKSNERERPRDPDRSRGKERDEPRHRHRSSDHRRDSVREETERPRDSHSHRSRRRSRSISANESEDSEEERRRRKKRKEKERRREEEEREERRRKKEKERREEDRGRERRNKNSASAPTGSYGKYGIITETDQTRMTFEFRAWLVEQRRLDPDVLPRDKLNKEFAIFVEDFNAATLPHEKYYGMAQHQRRIAAIRNGETVAEVLQYDPRADEKAHVARLRATHLPDQADLTREEIVELRRIEKERVEAVKRRQLGLEVPKGLGVRTIEVPLESWKDPNLF